MALVLTRILLRWSHRENTTSQYRKGLLRTQVSYQCLGKYHGTQLQLYSGTLPPQHLNVADSDAQLSVRYLRSLRLESDKKQIR